MLTVGKHVGKPYEDVARCDKKYCGWVLYGRSLPPSLYDFKAFLLNQYGGLVKVGKHKNKFFTEVVSEDPDYCHWAAGLSAPGPALQNFIAFLDGAQDPMPPASSSDIEITDNFSSEENDDESMSSEPLSISDAENTVGNPSNPDDGTQHVGEASGISAGAPGAPELASSSDTVPIATDGVDKEFKCKICFDGVINKVFIPCGHMVACDHCARRCRTCPMCRQHVQRAMRVYTS